MAIVGAFAVPHPPLIINGVGHGREREIARTIAAYEEVARRVAALGPQTIVISDPHSSCYLDYLHVSGGAGASGTMADFGDPADGSSVVYDQEFVRELGDEFARRGIAGGTQGERVPTLDWGMLVPLHFIDAAYEAGRAAGEEPPSFEVVRLGLAGFSAREHYGVGKAVACVAERLGRRAVWLASGDLSHKLSEDGPYGFAPEGPLFDELACKAFETGDFGLLLTADPAMCERAAECGLRSFQMMAGALDQTPLEAELLSYEGPFGVGYGVAAFAPAGAAGSAPERAFDAAYDAWHAEQMRAARAGEDAYVRLARASLEAYVRTGERMGPAANLPPDLIGRRAGAFVSLRKNGRLRGCIGTIEPTRATLAEEIAANAVSAGCHDPRFSPVEPDELDELVYDVDVLGEPEAVAGPGALDPARYGVIVSAPGGRRGLLLPDLDGVDTVDEQLRIAARKGGISLDEDGVRLWRFEVVRHL